MTGPGGVAPSEELVIAARPALHARLVEELGMLGAARDDEA